jgi:hypothetical protein
MIELTGSKAGQSAHQETGNVAKDIAIEPACPIA